MNIILFAPGELERPLSLSDRRSTHILSVLRRQPGDTFDAGVINGMRGKAQLQAVSPEGLRLRFEPRDEPPPLDPVILLIGMPRPQTVRKVLQEATALGVAAMRFVVTERGESGYARSTLWSSGEWRRHLVEGAQQAFCTRLPDIAWGETLRDTLDALLGESCRIALDNYEAASPLAACRLSTPLVLALGPEPGWSAAERRMLRDAGFRLAHLGPRVLRVDTACIASLAIVRASLGLMQGADLCAAEPAGRPVLGSP